MLWWSLECERVKLEIPKFGAWGKNEMLRLKNFLNINITQSIQ